MRWLEELATRRRFGIKPGLETITRLCAELQSPQDQLTGVVHIAGTNGKGAVAAILDSVFGDSGRYTSPHLVSLNERFFLRGQPIDDATLENVAEEVGEVIRKLQVDVTFFEALTAMAFVLYSRLQPRQVILETGLGGRLDATNICRPELTIITRIGLDHCAWLGNTVEQIAAEKAGIIKTGVPIVLGRNVDAVVEVVRRRANAVGANFIYAPDIADEGEIPADFALKGSFNRENALTAIAALKTLGIEPKSLGKVVWPGRFQQIGRYLVDGAHNPPAALALATALSESGIKRNSLIMIAGFCGDKDVAETLTILKPFIKHGLAVKTNNPRSLTAEETAAKMQAVGIEAKVMPSLLVALNSIGADESALVCGSLFLAGEAVVTLGAYPWRLKRFDPSESISPA